MPIRMLNGKVMPSDAVSDSDGRLATPIEVVHRSGNRQAEHRALADLAEEWEVEAVVVMEIAVTIMVRMIIEKFLQMKSSQTKVFFPSNANAASLLVRLNPDFLSS